MPDCTQCSTNCNKELKLSADASFYGLGDNWRPVAYASCTLMETEQRYAQVEKEALGLTWECMKDLKIL